MYKQSTSGRWAYKVSFEVLLDLKQVDLLYRLRDYFGVGTVYLGSTSATYRVISVKDLGRIIAHFTDYPLLSHKFITFTYWAKVVKLMQAKKHVTSTQTFDWIMSVYAALGRGASVAVKNAFPLLSPLSLPAYTLPVAAEVINPWWLSGYLTLYCSFSLNLEAAGWKNEIYHKYRHRFTFSLQPDLTLLATAISQYLGIPMYIRGDGRIDIMAQSMEETFGIISFFEDYPLQSYKNSHFVIWRDCVVQLEGDRSKNLPGNVLQNKFFLLMDKLNLLKQQDAEGNKE